MDIVRYYRYSDLSEKGHYEKLERQKVLFEFLKQPDLDYHKLRKRLGGDTLNLMLERVSTNWREKNFEEALNFIGKHFKVTQVSRGEFPMITVAFEGDHYPWAKIDMVYLHTGFCVASMCNKLKIITFDEGY